MRVPQLRHEAVGRHFNKMQNKPTTSKAVTALVVVELILSIIYLTRELLR